MDCLVKELFVATPLESEDINKFKLKFCKYEDNNVHIFDKNNKEEVIYTLQDVNNIDEYYTKHYYVRNFIENKERLFKDFMELFDVSEICNMKEDAKVDVDYIKLIEKTINEFYLDNKEK